jgi:hypothetical protein
MAEAQNSVADLSSAARSARTSPIRPLRMTNGKMLMLELKGQDAQEQQTKRQFLAEWIRTQNRHGARPRPHWSLTWSDQSDRGYRGID